MDLDSHWGGPQIGLLSIFFKRYKFMIGAIFITLVVSIANSFNCDFSCRFRSQTASGEGDLRAAPQEEMGSHAAGVEDCAPEQRQWFP